MKNYDYSMSSIQIISEFGMKSFEKVVQLIYDI